jgi:membrane-bound lytic murein transglycosylase MltF
MVTKIRSVQIARHSAWPVLGVVGALLCLACDGAMGQQLGKRPITVVIRPTTRDQLLKQVAEGFSDIAVGNLTVTEPNVHAGAKYMDQLMTKLVTAEKIGAETTTYVRNIYKYYVAYKLMLDVEEAQKKAREAVKQGK